MDLWLLLKQTLVARVRSYQRRYQPVPAHIEAMKILTDIAKHPENYTAERKQFWEDEYQIALTQAIDIQTIKSQMHLDANAEIPGKLLRSRLGARRAQVQLREVYLDETKQATVKSQDMLKPFKRFYQDLYSVCLLYTSPSPRDRG